MSTFTEALAYHADGIRVHIDARARATEPPGALKVLAGGVGAPADLLAAAAAMSPTPTAWVSRGGVVFVLADPGSGVVIHEGTGKPTVLQKRSISMLEQALALAVPGFVADSEPDPIVEPEQVVEIAPTVDETDLGETGE